MAIAAKTKAPASDSIMTPEKMKPMLALSKREPVHAAIGLTADGEGLILLDKKAKPKKVLSMLRADASKGKLQLNAASLRFGRAEVDTDYDSGMVRFFINKDAPGNMRMKLVEVVKRIPYQKVEINVDPTLEEEPEDEAEMHEGTAGAPPTTETASQPDPEALKRDLAGLIGRIAQIAGTDATRKAQLAKLATDANGALRSNDLAGATQLIEALQSAIDTVPTAPPPPPQTGADTIAPDALHKDLTGLVGRIAAAAGTDNAKKALLAKLATDANNALKANDPGTAGRLIAQLRGGIETQTGQGTKILPIWRDARDTTGDQFNKLQDAMKNSGLPLFARIADRGLNGITETRLVTLQVALMEVDAAQGEARAKAVEKTRTAITDMRGFLQTNPVLRLLDANPLKVPLTLQATLTGALDNIDKALTA
jgi:hypothetical protein